MKINAMKVAAASGNAERENTWEKFKNKSEDDGYVSWLRCRWQRFHCIESCSRFRCWESNIATRKYPEFRNKLRNSSVVMGYWCALRTFIWRRRTFGRRSRWNMFFVTFACAKIDNRYSVIGWWIDDRQIKILISLNWEWIVRKKGKWSSNGSTHDGLGIIYYQYPMSRYPCRFNYWNRNFHSIIADWFVRLKY